MSAPGRLERELKYRLRGEEDWRSLQAGLGPPLRAVTQVNHYLEAPDGRLGRASALLRVRLEGDGDRVLTFKKGERVQAGYFEAVEVDAQVSLSEQEALWGGSLEDALWSLSPLRAFEEDLGRAPLSLLGTIENLRLSFPLPSGGLLELDRTRFPDGSVDHEVEIETCEPELARGWFEALAGRLGIAAEPQLETKFERFLARAGGS